MKEINLFDPEVRRNPYPAYSYLRNHPVQKVEPLGAWVLSRSQDIQYALRHPELFSSTAFRSIVAPEWCPECPLADSPLTMDGPEHTKFRTLIGRAFTPSMIAQLEPRIRQLAAAAADAMVGHDQVDFIQSFAVPFPAQAIAEILGLDPSLTPHFGVWADHIASISPIEPPPDYAKSVKQTVADMTQYIQEVIESRRQNPRGDIISLLIEANIDGEHLDASQVLGFMSLLLPAGFETTRHLLANIMLCFLNHPGLRRLRQDPAQIPSFIEEVLRFDPPVHSVARFTTQDVVVGDVSIPANSMVFILIGAAGRDSENIEDAENFDPTREQRNLLSFGHGPHYCIGASLARLEARVGVEELLKRFRGFEPGAPEPEWNISATVRGPLQLFVRPLSA
ncbi:cytochrome P450 [Pseudenhygromyxa sp. WMMC2535]|uniref:cytochrome P450 n=1 Tax=Pseudenhygromyxa sp. WMMC2535 TaxID=2712867 RepID=UPI001555CB6B|nr:cytochrome P450 [Pseudenhygromyxa sp. WMMC2535]NVB37651.1 cytochrome P450 [Pseudenhygromyxa sp. WMMC2535]